MSKPTKPAVEQPTSKPADDVAPAESEDATAKPIEQKPIEIDVIQRRLLAALTPEYQKDMPPTIETVPPVMDEKVVARIKEEFGEGVINQVQVSEANTIAELAELIADRLGELGVVVEGRNFELDAKWSRECDEAIDFISGYSIKHSTVLRKHINALAVKAGVRSAPKS